MIEGKASVVKSSVQVEQMAADTQQAATAQRPHHASLPIKSHQAGDGSDCDQWQSKRLEIGHQQSRPKGMKRIHFFKQRVQREPDSKIKNHAYDCGRDR